MKDYMVIHTFKSEEIRQQYFAMSQDMTPDDIRAQMKNDNASFQMNWNAGEDDMAMYCWWKANSPEAIIETLGEMGEMFHNDVKEMPNMIDVTDLTSSSEEGWRVSSALPAVFFREIDARTSRL